MQIGRSICTHNFPPSSLLKPVAILASVCLVGLTIPFIAKKITGPDLSHRSPKTSLLTDLGIIATFLLKIPQATYAALQNSICCPAKSTRPIGPSRPAKPIEPLPLSDNVPRSPAARPTPMEKELLDQAIKIFDQYSEHVRNSVPEGIDVAALSQMSQRYQMKTVLSKLGIRGVARAMSSLPSMDSTQIALLGRALSLIRELIAENEKGVPLTEFTAEKLSLIEKSMSGVLRCIARLTPTEEDLLEKASLDAAGEVASDYLKTTAASPLIGPHCIPLPPAKIELLKKGISIADAHLAKGKAQPNKTTHLIELMERLKDWKQTVQDVLDQAEFAVKVLPPR